MPVLISLGFWQLGRAETKEQLLASYEAKSQSMMDVSQLLAQEDMAFQRVSLEGVYDNGRSFLLDNKTFHGRVGYEVITPFILANPPASSRADNDIEIVLVNRGWLPMGPSRQQLPDIPGVKGTLAIIATVDVPEREAFVLQDQPLTGSWPLVIQISDVARMAEELGQPTFPFVVRLSTDSTGALQTVWKPVIMQPEKNFAYAVQWFALAATLSVLFIFATIKRTNEAHSE